MTKIRRFFQINPCIIRIIHHLRNFDIDTFYYYELSGMILLLYTHKWIIFGTFGITQKQLILILNHITLKQLNIILNNVILTQSNIILNNVILEQLNVILNSIILNNYIWY